MHTARRARLALVLAAWGAVLPGCVAQIGEQRLVGPTRPIAASRSETVVEREAPATTTAAPTTDAAPARCRNIVITSPLVRDVTVRRYFVGDGQAIDVALSALAGVAVALMAYGVDQAGCSDGGVCHDLARVNGPIVAVAGLALVPLAFAGYNAIRVQDSQITEYALPELAPGPWAPCREETLSSRDAPRAAQSATR